MSSRSVVNKVRNRGFKVRLVDARSSPQVVRKYKVRRVPTFIYIRGGEEVRRRSGPISAGALQHMFRPPLW